MVSAGELPGNKQYSKLELEAYPAMGLSEARAKARAWRDLVRQGHDPRELEADRRRQAEEARRRVEAEANNTFALAAGEHIAARHKAARNRRAKHDEAEIRRDRIGPRGDRSVASITPADVRDLMRRLIKRAPSAARAAWGHGELIFARAVNDGTLTVSPFASLKKHMCLVGAEKRARDRVLWRAPEHLSYPELHLYRWLLLTGCRLNEGAGARWVELHPELRRSLRDRQPISTVAEEHRLWTVPSERFKQNRVNLVPLSGAVCELLASIPMRGEYLFSFDGKKAIWPGNKVKVRLDALMVEGLRSIARKRGDDPDVVTLLRWVNYDMRHTLRTNLSALGFSREIAEATVGHAKGGIEKVYNHYEYLPEKRAALQAWADKVAALVKG